MKSQLFLIFTGNNKVVYMNTFPIIKPTYFLRLKPKDLIN